MLQKIADMVMGSLPEMYEVLRSAVPHKIHFKVFRSGTFISSIEFEEDKFVVHNIMDCKTIYYSDPKMLERLSERIDKAWREWG